jgi:hypothetical protein
MAENSSVITCLLSLGEKCVNKVEKLAVAGLEEKIQEQQCSNNFDPRNSLNDQVLEGMVVVALIITEAVKNMIHKSTSTTTVVVVLHSST